VPFSQQVEHDPIVSHGVGVRGGSDPVVGDESGAASRRDAVVGHVRQVSVKRAVRVLGDKGVRGKE